LNINLNINEIRTVKIGVLVEGEGWMKEIKVMVYG
jgi:hypothetical protein